MPDQRPEPHDNAPRILVVDDDAQIVELLSGFFRTEGFVVASAGDVAGGRRRIAEGDYDVAVFDLAMPDGTGLELLRDIKEHRPATPVIILTGWPDVDSAVEAVRAGAMDYLTKPVRREEVVRLAKHAVEMKRLAEAKRDLEAENRRYRDGLERQVEERTAALSRALEELQHVERDLRATEHERNTLLDALDEHIIRHDRELHIRWANRAACESAGQAREEIVGRHCYEIWAQSDAPCEGCPVLQAMATGRFAESERATPDGRLWWVRGYPVRDHDGTVAGGVEVTQDITRQKRMEMELRGAQKLEAVGRLASGIAHEINTPVQFVGDNLRFLQDTCKEVIPLLTGYVDLLGRLGEGVPSPDDLAARRRALDAADVDFIAEEVPGAIAQSLEGTGRIAEIVRAMKEFAHPGHEGLEPADLNQAIQTTVTIAKNEWKYVAEVETELDPDLPPVPCLVSEFNQVLLNLIVNARDAIAERVGDDGATRGTITITSGLDGDWARIDVVDTGCGMPPAVQEKIFDPFFTTKEVGVGSGQGLAMARNIVVEKHRGRLEVESEEGRGTRFTIRLPLTITKQE